MKVKKNLIRLGPTERLYQLDIPLVGLTGGIATGKSSVSNLLKQKSHPLISADELVKKVYQIPESLHFIQKIAPECLSDEGRIDFKKLRQLAFAAPSLLGQIESFIYQRLPSVFNQELLGLKKQGPVHYLIYDVPLLFEKELSTKIDISLLVYSTRDQQKQRVALRDKSSDETIEQILNKQLSIDKKKEMADFIIENTGSQDQLFSEVHRIEKLIFEKV